MTDGPFRIYLRSRDRIMCRHDFAAQSEEDARRTAEILAEATSDLCDSFELWLEKRIIAGAAPRSRAGVPQRVPTATVEAAEALLQSGWPVAESRLLLSCLARWRGGPDACLLESIIREAVSAVGADKGNIQLVDGAGDLR